MYLNKNVWNIFIIPSNSFVKGQVDNKSTLDQATLAWGRTQNNVHQDPWRHMVSLWASWQIHKIAGCPCAGNTGTFSPPPRLSDTNMHHGTCVTHVPWCMPGWLTSGVLWSRWRGKHSRHLRNPRQGVQPQALTKFPDYSLTFPWPFGVFPWPRDKILTFHYRLNTHLACNLTNHTPKLAITKK